MPGEQTAAKIGQGFRQLVRIPEVSLDFVKLDIGGGDWIQLSLENAHFTSYSYPEAPPPQLMMMAPTVPFVLVVNQRHLELRSLRGCRSVVTA